MNKPTLVLKCTPVQYKKVVILANHVKLQMTGNSNFTTPNPAITVLGTALTNLEAAIALWGTTGNHTGTANERDVLAKSLIVYNILMKLSEYCMNTVDDTLSFEDQTVILLSSGFAVKDAATPQGKLGVVQNFRRFISRTLNEWEYKMRWKRPLAAKKGNVKLYNLKRNTVNNYATATIIAEPTATTYTDSPDAGTYYYWVVGVNNKGEGVVSPVLVFQTFGPPAP